MRNNLLFFIGLLCGSAVLAQTTNQPPDISNFTTTVDWPNNTLTLTYDATDAENDLLEVSVAFSPDNGHTYLPPSQVTVSGDTGFPVTPGTGRTITCDISALAGISAAFTVRLVADDKQPFDIQQLVGEVDSIRLREDLEFVEGIRHRVTGPAHLDAVRDSIAGHFSALGLSLNQQFFSYGNATGENIIGTFPGTSDAEKVVLVDAHYDTVNNAPGADDNGSGVVGFMEISRLLSRYPAKKTIRYIGFDMEEDGLRGSIDYVSNDLPAAEQIEGVFNFEMIGYYSEQPNSQEIPTGFDIFFPDATTQIINNQKKGDFITNVANSNCASLALLFSTSAAQYVPDLKVITLVAPGNGSLFADLLRSDHAPFWFANKPALMLTDGADFRNDCYHTPQDMAEGKLNFTFMSNVVKATLASVAQLAEIQHADWAVTTFDGILDSKEPNGCRFDVRHSSHQNGVLAFTFGDCPFKDVHIEVLDEKGRLIQNAWLTILETEQQYDLPLPQLPAGMYFAQLSWPGGMHTEKFVVSR
ncbi:MAG: hypothetical protein EPGJADBJ_00909 [Saprospiraceae bacterium]|nr:hypothetical protein [Saprospiraceae bacterium]